MKDIKQIQEYNRRKIICAVHGVQDYEEALLREKDKNAGTISFCKNCAEFISIGNALDNFIKFEGNSIALDRVLLALDYYDIGYIASSSDKMLTITIGKIYNKLSREIVFNWNLTKPTLEQQDFEVQMTIYKLLGGE